MAVNPLITDVTDLPVRYHGSLTDRHGAYTAALCRCTLHSGRPTTVQLQLTDTHGAIAVSCVRPNSVTALTPATAGTPTG